MLLAISAQLLQEHLPVVERRLGVRLGGGASWIVATNVLEDREIADTPVSHAVCFRRRFEENRELSDTMEIEEAVRAGHNQVDVALHYKICYPRPEYADPGTVGGDSDFRRRSSRANTRLGRMSKSRVQSQFRPPTR
ncbi:hypothetical protein BBJ28_00014189 [Nothophytophthora sp. Chile5]|nr:hypothetical protein BBJ28_00014189 [Nothophytophthora sp. Chile5]